MRVSDALGDRFAHLLRVVLEKVELHDFGDAQQQGAVDGGFAEDFIDVVAGAGNLPGQPTRATLVAFQLRLDKAADVDVSRIGALCSHKKNRELFVEARGSGKTHTTNKKAHGLIVSVSTFLVVCL